MPGQTVKSQSEEHGNPSGMVNSTVVVAFSITNHAQIGPVFDQKADSVDGSVGSVLLPPPSPHFRIGRRIRLLGIPQCRLPETLVPQTFPDRSPGSLLR